MTTAPFRFPLIPILLFFAILAGNVSAAEETGKQSLAILPFTVNATKDISYLQAGIRNMLASRLAADTGLSIIDQSRVDQQAKAAGDTKQQNLLIQLGNTLQTDYLLSGTLTAIGQSLSLDAKLYPVKDPGKPVESFYASAPTEDDIITAVDSLAWDIAEKSFGKQRPVPKYPQQAQCPATLPCPCRAFNPPHYPPVNHRAIRHTGQLIRTANSWATTREAIMAEALPSSIPRQSPAPLVSPKPRTLTTPCRDSISATLTGRQAGCCYRLQR